MLRCAALGSSHFFTSGALELRDRTEEWEAVAEFAGVPPARLRLLHQVHGNRIVVAHAGSPDPWIRPEADGVISDDPSIALVVRVADCAPLLMADRRTGVTAAVHAGWRSTMHRIAPAAVEALRREFGTRPQDLVVALGPSLGACCGEMGPEVVDAFRAAGHEAASLARWFRREGTAKPHFDLWLANRDQLEASGVDPAAVHVAALCTRTHADVFHSYRARGPMAGRMAAVIRGSVNVSAA